MRRWSLGHSTLRRKKVNTTEIHQGIRSTLESNLQSGLRKAVESKLHGNTIRPVKGCAIESARKSNQA